MTTLLDNLASEIKAVDEAGNKCLDDLVSETDSVLASLRQVEKNLQNEVDTSNVKNITDKWYTSSIGGLKTYNSKLNKFLKNILNNSKYSVELDESYPFPLNLNNFPVKETRNGVSELEAVRTENRDELLKAIMLHLLRIGKCDLVREMISLVFLDEITIDDNLFELFNSLNYIVAGITKDHDLSQALGWFKNKYNRDTGILSGDGHLAVDSAPATSYIEIEFKFHALQYILLLQKDTSHNMDVALSAYLYAKENFPRFFKYFNSIISVLMCLLIPQNGNDDGEDTFLKKNMTSLYSDLRNMMNQSFELQKDGDLVRSSGVDEFVNNVLCADNIHDQQTLFINLSNEFVSEYCKNMKLSSDSSLFQAILAGFINMPNFYKYNALQRKLKKPVRIENSSLRAPFNHDLPFSLPDASRFLFKFHPIFICPVSKEQLIPLTPSNDDDEKSRKRKKRFVNEADLPNFKPNPVVVLEHCNHLALKDSIWQLSKRGTENFKCHYCYTKHKFSEVSDAYFIDL